MSDPIQTTKPQKSTDNVKQNQQDPNKFSYNFVYKATIVLIFFVILPLFPSQAPDFINQNLLTRNWELLHLLFVGIAISYGLFSRRNQEHDKDNNNNNSKFDSAQTLVSRFLQVSSFFEDEIDHQNQSAESDEITKLQTWSNQNQHYRNKPMVVVAPQVKDSVFEDKQSGGEEKEKPLLLPVRSLKSRLSDEAGVLQSQSVDGSSKIGSKRFSSNSFNKVRNYGEFEGVIANKMKAKDEEKENVVLASPIPWRSRSASARMMEPKKEAIEKTSKASMPKASSMKFTPSESIAKDAEDSIKKKSFNYKSCFPPPPPPPPPPMFQKPIFMKSIYGEKNGRNKSMEKSIEEGINEKEDEDEDKEQKEYSSSMQKPTEKERFIEKRVIMETEEEETDSEEDEDVEKRKQSEETCTKTEEPSCSYSVGDEGPDVDKKADEFIAKFREQIRLQRIESIKRSTRVVRNSSR
ncbi:unnamed protein product [Lathyrus oleraceus]|uniref:Hydroxyproline-rich glycoprotein family protein n=1 Tax=Pisum sativum TaxID=3888 RepID=A0A9D4XBY4_PEA|nr:uncharacterized protein LOC127074207 [Pisum sativum]KAI5417573.1 hypothetical protein KIW84_042252 [Pisum sativum]